MACRYLIDISVSVVVLLQPISARRFEHRKFGRSRADWSGSPAGEPARVELVVPSVLSGYNDRRDVAVLVSDHVLDSPY